MLKDTLPEAVELQQGSVRIVDPKTQGEIQGAASFYDPATRVLTINVPDATPARVTYKAVVLLQPGQSLDGLAVNTVTLVGYENKGGSSQDSQTGTVHEAKGGFTDSRTACRSSNTATETPADAVWAMRCSAWTNSR